MGYLAFYRKYRPSKFSEVVGQESIVKILRNSIINNNISHAYLFSGPRGTGKTSIAKIFARSVNCLNTIDGEMCGKCKICKQISGNDIDIIEIDAASNNGVDEIREIRNNVKLSPTIGKYKVYIIDEVHMLSIGAFNALLKTLEEPPSHVIFILATTEVQKIPLTIISRCQKFNFNKITNTIIINLLKKIIEEENKNVSEEVLSLIAELSDGGLRDAINLLDQILSNCSDNPTVDDIYAINGQIPTSIIKQMFDYILYGNLQEILSIIKNLYETGKNFETLCNNLILFTRNILINNNVKDYFQNQNTEIYQKYENIPNETIFNISDELISLSQNLKKSTNQKILFELKMFELININVQKDMLNEKKDQKTTQKTVKRVEKTEIISREIISQIINVRKNNVFVSANKDSLKEIKNKFDDFSDYLSNKKYTSIVSIISKGKIIVASNDYIMLEYDSTSLANLFNSNLITIEKFLEMALKSKFKVIGITKSEWELLKSEYVKKTKSGYKYVLQSEPDFIPKSEIKNDSIVEDIFGEDIISFK